MEYYSTKICTKCFSAQEPHSRFCDNCGKAFEETAATDGNISMITKTFFKQQVSQTRPFFWLCIIIVGMLTVFGFAEVGMFRGGSVNSAGAATQVPVSLVSREQTVAGSSDTQVATPVQHDTMLDLNDSVFEMKDSGPGVRSVPKRRTTPVSQKPSEQSAKTEAAATADGPASAEHAIANAPEKEPAKPAENGTATPRAYQKGPMGGCFYISASGSKRYVDRGMCN